MPRHCVGGTILLFHYPIIQNSACPTPNLAGVNPNSIIPLSKIDRVNSGSYHTADVMLVTGLDITIFVV